MHPWITRDVNGTIPLNFHDQIEKTNKLYDKFKGLQNLVLSVAVMRDKFIKKPKEDLLDEYKYQIIKEEFLDFTPTPKKEKKEVEDSESFTHDLLYVDSGIKTGKFCISFYREKEEEHEDHQEWS